MRNTARLCAAAGTAALLMLTTTAAFGDVVSNKIDDDVDSTVEVMTLEYDGVHGIAGPTVKTQLVIDVEGAYLGQNGNKCDVSGDKQYVTLQLANRPTHVDVAFPDGLRFDDCGQALTVEVTPKAVGVDRIAFEVDESKTAAEKGTFTLDTASFDAVVEAADLSQDPGTGTKCDKNPAAPAWAAALLQANHLKPKAKDGENYVKQVARQMERRAAFPDASGVPVAKDADQRAYPKAVLAYMQDELGLPLTKGLDDVKRPGWVCRTVG